MGGHQLSALRSMFRNNAKSVQIDAKEALEAVTSVATMNVTTVGQRTHKADRHSYELVLY